MTCFKSKVFLFVVLIFFSFTSRVKGSSSPPVLRSLGIVNTEDDDHQVAAVFSVNPTTGGAKEVDGNFSWSVQWTTSLDCASTYSTKNSLWYSIIGEGPSVAIVNASSGKLVHLSAPIDPNYIIISTSFDDEKGILFATGVTSTNTVDYLSIDPLSGKVNVITKALVGYHFPLPCSSAISLSSSTFYTISDDQQNDDSDQVIESYDLLSGKLLHSYSWPSKTKNVGPLGQPVAVQSSKTGGSDVLTLVWSDFDGNKPIRFITLDLATGMSIVLAELPSKYKDMVIDIGGITPQAVKALPDGSFNITAVSFDNSEDQAYLLQLAVHSGGSSGNVYLVKLDCGGSFLWNPVYV
jgi:hypothetical protein